jgi:hypothetical protein
MASAAVARTGTREASAKTEPGAEGMMPQRLAAWSRKAAAGSKGQFLRQAAVEGAKGKDRVKITKHGKAKNGIDRHISTEGKGDDDTSTICVDVGSGTANDGREVAMIGSVKVRRVTNSATKLDRVKGIGVVQLNELGHLIRALKLEPN